MLLNLILTFFTAIFSAIACFLGIAIFLDYFISSIIFLFSGHFDSILQIGLERALHSVSSLDSSVWKLNTGLKGFDLIINKFIGLQYDVSGRWKMFAFSTMVIIIFCIIGVLTDVELFPNGSEPNTPNEDSLTVIIGGVVSLALIAPILVGAISSLVFLFF